MRKAYTTESETGSSRADFLPGFTPFGGVSLKIQWKKLILCVAIPLGVGGLAALLTGESMKSFETLNKPPLSPPGWLFPIVWTILYLLMGVSSYLVLVSAKPGNLALKTYAAQLAVNFFWPIFFFKLQWYLFSFFWLLLLWCLILLTALLFRRFSKTAAFLLIPYLIWVAFAGYLNLSIYLLN